MTTWMRRKVSKLEPDIRELVLDYLEETQGLDEQEHGALSPWASPLYRPNPLW